MTDSWLHTAPAFPTDQWSAAWTDSLGPDFSPDHDSPEQAAAVASLVQAAGLKAAAWVKQVHGDTILRVDRPGPAGSADGLWTDTPGLGVIGRSADCPLILVGGAGPDGSGVWGFAHASWRSTILGITGRLVSVMTESGAVSPEKLSAQICPSAGPCCYEVGDEVREEALTRLGPDAARFFSPLKDKWILDLWEANRTQLTEAGVNAESIRIAGECTICGSHRYPSYRRSGPQARRFAGIIGR